MPAENLLLIITIAVGVSAAAIVMQAILMFATYRSSRKMKEQVTALSAKLEPLSESARDVLALTRKQVTEVSAKATEVLELTRRQLGRIDEVLGEATVRTRAQMDRIEMVIDDTVNRFQETTAVLQDGLMKPLRQLSGVTAAVRAMVAALFGGSRPTVEQATHDEEMFI